MKRKEYDINIGYYILPTLVISLGYKRADIDRASDLIASSYKLKGLLAGVSGSAPIADRLSLYGSFAYGLARETTESALPNEKTNLTPITKLVKLDLVINLFGPQVPNS